MQNEICFNTVDRYRDIRMGIFTEKYTKAQATKIGMTAYLYKKETGKLTAKIFYGTSKKETYTLEYDSEKERNNSITALFARQFAPKKKRAIRVNDILIAISGKTQKSIDYYKVLKRNSSTLAHIIKIGLMFDETEYETLKTYSAPDLNRLISLPMLKRLEGNSVKIDTHRNAFLVEPSFSGNCVKLYDRISFS